MFYCNSFPTAFTCLPPAFQCVLRLSSTKLLSEHFQTLDESELYILYPSTFKNWWTWHCTPQKKKKRRKKREKKYGSYKGKSTGIIYIIFRVKKHSSFNDWLQYVCGHVLYQQLIKTLTLYTCVCVCVCACACVCVRACVCDCESCSYRVKVNFCSNY